MNILFIFFILIILLLTACPDKCGVCSYDAASGNTLCLEGNCDAFYGRYLTDSKCYGMFPTILLYTSLQSTILLYTILLHTILLYTILLCTLLLYVYTIVLCTVLQYTILLCSILLYAILLCTILLLYLFRVADCPRNCHSCSANDAAGEVLVCDTCAAGFFGNPNQCGNCPR